jgi:hypothetical protein
MKRRLPLDAELAILLAEKTNAEIARLFGTSYSAVSMQRKRLQIPFKVNPKTCCSCGHSSPSVSFHRDSSRTDGMSTYCKACQVKKNKKYRHKHAEKFRVHSKWKYETNREACLKNGVEYYQENKEKVWAKKIQRAYGIDAIQFKAMLESQDGKCAICHTLGERKIAKKLFIDHCHKTGKVRGILCGNCNSLLGYAKDRSEILQNAAVYLDSAKL